MRLTGVNALDIDQVWHLAAPLLAKSFDYSCGEQNLDTLRSAIESRKMQLWVGIDDNNTVKMAAVSQIINYPTGKKIAEASIMGGEEVIGSAKNIAEMFEDWARSEGCHATRIYGRKGWQKVHPGYTPQYIVLHKELT